MNSISKSTILLLLLGLFLTGFTTQLSAQCVTGQVPVTISLQTDASPQETEFQLRDLTTGQIIFSIGNASLIPNATHNYSICAPAGHCLKTELIDAGANGGPSVTIVYDQITTYQSPDPGNFAQFETILMGSQQCTDLGPVNNWSNYPFTSLGGLRIGNNNSFSGPVAAALANGGVCIGDNNRIQGWLAGGEVGYGASNIISGYNNLRRFGTAPAISPCGNSPAPSIDDFHVTVPGLGNSTDCQMADLIPVANQSIEVPSGVNEMIFPGNYTSIIVNQGATLLAMPGGYTAGEIIVDGGRLLPGGGGVLCDIFFQASDVQIANGSTVRATINCKHVIIGNGNEIEGFIHVMDPAQTSTIGDFNTFKMPACPPCEAALKNNGRGDQGFVPIETPKEFKIVPHPVSGAQFGISATGVLFPARLSIYDLSGLLVHEIPIRQADDLNRMSRNGLAPGMYICKLDSADGTMRTSKMLIRGN